MVDEAIPEEQLEMPIGVGGRLRAAREAQGLSLAQVAAETRINQRHLVQIEQGDFGGLPARTYAIGFTRTYARMLGLDDAAIADEVRAELALLAPRDTRALTFEPGDPARVPSARLAWFSALAALILFIGGAVFIWTRYVSPAASLPWLTGNEQPVPAPSAKPSPAPPTTELAGDVVFKAEADQVWVRFYDAQGRQLLQKELAMGETFTVPRDATGPMIRTARADALSITVGGKPVPKLADSQGLIKDVPVDAAALAARVGTGLPSSASTPQTAR